MGKWGEGMRSGESGGRGWEVADGVGVGVGMEIRGRGAVWCDNELVSKVVHFDIMAYILTSQRTS